MSMGWQPRGRLDAQTPGDPLHLMEAAGQLAPPASDLPGAQVIGEGDSIRVLDPDRGDELADWSADGFTAQFGPGWRIEDHPHGPGTTAEQWEQIIPLPDYAPGSRCSAPRAASGSSPPAPPSPSTRLWWS
ncbi:hypothetical protein ACIPSA_45375 [Streptomyces sp. NPDC086549]|uniref:hypothetical protein n=1 Tax=Streptomyces sp. NPDC086549 TaxID=3365752 RepID=UPI00382C114A